MQLKTQRLLLRELEQNDLQSIHELNSIPEVDTYNTLGIPENTDVTKQLLNEIILAQLAQARIRYVFVIENIDSKNLLGMCGLLIGKPKYMNAEIWYKLNPLYWKQGFASEAVQALLQFGFKDLKLHRIEAGCSVENNSSIKVLEKNGFIREGRTRKLLPIRGQWHDNFGYAILEQDYFQMEKVQ